MIVRTLRVARRLRRPGRLAFFPSPQAFQDSDERPAPNNVASAADITQNAAESSVSNRGALRAFVARFYSRKGEMGRWEFFWRALFLLSVLSLTLFAAKVPIVLLVYEFDIINSSMLVKWLFILGEAAAGVALFVYPFINISVKRLRNAGLCSKYLYEYVALFILAFEVIQRFDLHYAMGLLLYGVYIGVLSLIFKTKKNPVAES